MRPRWIDLMVGAAAASTYLLLLPHWSPGDLVVAVAVAAGVLGIVRPGGAESLGRRLARHIGPSALLRLPSLAVRLLIDSARGTWQMTWIALGIGDRPCPGLVEFPMEERSDLESAVLGLLVTVGPGQVLVRLDRERRVLLFHVAGSTAEAFKAGVDRLSAGHVRPLFLPEEEGEP